MNRNLRSRVLATGLAIALGIGGLASGAAEIAAAPAGAGFNLTPADLQFILKQIKIAEAHATREGGSLGTVVAPTPLVGPGVNDITDPKLPWGLRQVDGRNNNLTAGQSTWDGKLYTSTPGKSAWGAADQPFVRMTPALWRTTEEPGYPTTELGAVSTNYDPAYRPSSIQDSSPRTISNLIVDQSSSNPAAVEAAGPAPTVDVDGSLLIPNVAPNAGVAAPYNGVFALFGQFFDHGLDLVGKTGNENVVVPLQPDDPLYVPNSPVNFMIANRTVLDQNNDGTNTTTPWIDQNQTYTSHPSHQVFLREYAMTNNRPVGTGNLLDGAIAGNIANWSEVKAQALTKLGIRLVDTDISNVPLLLTDEYGRFLRGPNGFPQMVMNNGTVVEGNLANPVATTNAVRTGHAFLDDIAHTAAPGTKTPDADSIVGNQPPTGTYDDELLGVHFITGDGRGNENIGLTSVHTVFHLEHNRLMADMQSIITANSGSFATLDWKLSGGAWNGERLFQAARFVNEMEYQHLVFGEFARKVQPGIRAFAAYDPNLRPDITAEFAHAVYRFGHSQLDSLVERTNADGSNNDSKLLDVFLNPVAFNNGGTAGSLNGAQAAGSVFRGMTNQVGNEIDEFVTNTLRNTLLGLPLDLATLNIVRGRDTGTASLNGARRSFYDQTGNAALAPYTSWADFHLALRHPASAVNFVAAYGTHPTITSAVTVADKRAAAEMLVNDQIGSPADRADFMFGSGAWADVNGLSVTGLDDIDLWVGGLAEARSPFGGMLGSTFDYVFKRQMENLQEGDRLYYLARTAGTNLGVQLEANTFAEIIMRNTDVGALPADAFAWPTLTIDMNAPGGAPAEVTVLPDGTWRYAGNAHVVINGTPGNDRSQSDNGDDTIRGNDGNDWMQGGKGNDNLVGGLGNDRILDSSGADILNGGDGNDYIATGGPGADLFNAGAGSDFLVGGNDATAMLGGLGNDLAYGGEAADAVSGDDGSDWLEGGSGSDTISGDQLPPFGIDLSTPGDDVIIGGLGDDLMDGAGGSDMSVSGTGIDTFIGGFGFDWQTYFDSNPATAVAANADLNLFVPAPGDILAGLMDGFDGVEALSGGDLNDTLKGDIRTTLTTPLTTSTDILNSADIAKIQGLAALLGSGVTQWNAGNILIGGRGSDLLEGRSGNDFIDGDAWLTVQLSVPAASGVVGTLDPATGRILVKGMSAVRQAVENGTLNPGDIQFVRTINGGAYAGEIDTAAFTGNRVDYTITYPGNGVIRVVDNIVGRDGTDTLRNVEALRFLDTTVVTQLSSAPQSVTNKSASTSLAVSWTAPGYTAGAAITGYNARAYTTAEGNTTAGTSCTTTALTCTITGLTNWTTYYVEVTATNATGTSPAGPRPRLVAAPGTAPGVPTAVLSGSNVDGSVTTSWTAPSSNGGSAVNAYKAWAYDAITGGTAVRSCTTTGALTCNMTGLNPGVLYYVEVTASNIAATGAPSTPRVAVAPLSAPGAPLSVTAAASPSTAVVRWGLPATSGGYFITEYTAYAYTTVNGTTPVGSCTITVTSLSDPLTCPIAGLTNGRTYSVEVKAKNAIGQGIASKPRASVKPAALPTAPGSPILSAVTATSLTATWTAADGSGNTITGYTATAYTTVDGMTVAASCSTSGALTCGLSGLTPGTGYWVSVVARNSLGAGAASSRSAATTTALTAPGSPNITGTSVTRTSATVTWLAPISNGGSSVTGYTAKAYLVAGVTPVGTCATTTALSCTISTLTSGTTYELEVVATNVINAGLPSARSTVATPAPTAPGAPTIASFSPGNGTMRVNWTAPADNGGSTITGYIVRAYSTLAGTTVVRSCTASVGSTNCTVSSLSRKVKYWFTVSAINAINESLPSARGSATTN
ncbi:unannotated protein [freshwater metagenome]|uniref:Unannotated protein n=1 Tax=freshwater metagenome TaxID=449393 RepID=A0A6J7F9I6_9ZZZZ|nr:heme peroxidase [Actinomycetota bacterium]